MRQHLLMFISANSRNLMARRGRPVEDQITDAQRRTLKGIQDFIARRKYPPTMNELGGVLNVTAASAHQLVKQLVRKGYVTHQPRQARSLAVVREPRSEPEALVSIPLIGLVKAGPAMLAEENREGEVLVESSLAGRGACFALRISGDSMVGAGMKDGSIVIVRQQPVAESGEVVVALIGEEATVKRLFIHGDCIELRAENKRYKPILVSGETEFRILGKVIAIRH
jgi:repressor LexA